MSARARIQLIGRNSVSGIGLSRSVMSITSFDTFACAWPFQDNRKSADRPGRALMESLRDALDQCGLPAPLAQFIGAGAVILVEGTGFLGLYAFERVSRDDVNLDRIAAPAAGLGPLGPSHLRHDDHPGRQRRSHSLDTPKLPTYAAPQSKRAASGPVIRDNIGNVEPRIASAARSPRATIS
jgi:hypothetical protein